MGLLFARCGLLYSTPYSWTSLIPDDDLHLRHALNAWLQGLSSSGYAEVAGQDKYADDLPQPQYRTEAVREARLAIFRQLVREPAFRAVLLTRYRPEYLLLPAIAPEPRRAGPWRLIDKSPRWALWERMHQDIP